MKISFAQSVNPLQLDNTGLWDHVEVEVRLVGCLFAGKGCRCSVYPLQLDIVQENKPGKLKCCGFSL